MPITITVTEPATPSEVSAARAMFCAETAPPAGGTAPPPSGGTATPPAGGSTPPPVDTNVYPLTMPDGITAGAPVALGSGPNSIQIYAANNPSGAVANSFVVIANRGATQTAIAGPLLVSSKSGASMSGAQLFTIKGDFAGLTGLQLVAAGAGLNGIWINQLSVDLIPWMANTDAANSRGSGTASYGTQVFNSNGRNMLFLPPSALPVVVPPAPPPALTAVSGATVNGAAAPAGTLAALIAATPASGTLVLPAGVIVGTSAVSGAVAGAGMGQTTIDATGLPPYQNKAVLVPAASGVTIRDLTIKGAVIPASLGNNAAGVREGGVGQPFTLVNVEITGCQNGVLTFADDVTLTGGKTHDNGAGDGYTHEMYFGGSPTNVVTLTDWTSTCGPKSTHALKSRAGTTIVNGGAYTGSPDTTGNVGGSVIDIPDAGAVTITGATIAVAVGAANTLLLGYGMESAKNAATGLVVTLKNCVFPTGGLIQNGAHNPTATLVLDGCTYSGATAPEIRGFTTVTGTIAKAA